MRIIGAALVALSACASAPGVYQKLGDTYVDREAVSKDWPTVPAFALPLIEDAKSRIESDRLYDLSCFEFAFGFDEDDASYFVLVSHSEIWLRANNKIVGDRHNYEGGFDFCGPDVSFSYSRSGRYIGKAYQR